MTTRLSFLVSNSNRSLGVAALFVMLGAAILSMPGCSDPPTVTQPPGGCDVGAIDDASQTDCIQRVCQDGVFVDKNDDTEVPDDGNACTDDACVAGKAQNTPNTASCMMGTASGMCVDGTCTIACTTSADCDDGKKCTTDACVDKACSYKVDEANVDDMNPCTVDSCPGGKETHVNADAGTACGPTGKGMCDGMGKCMGCETNADCENKNPCVVNLCVSQECIPMPKADQDLPDDVVGDCQLPTCVSGVLTMVAQNLDIPEDSNDCTADTCTEGVAANDPLAAESPCSMGVCDGMKSCVQCVTAADCKGDFSCSMNKCFACNDMMKNGTESDTDCGRDCANKCTDGRACNDGTDCFYGSCAGNVCISCYDSVKNGDESDVDCGAVCDLKCSVGKVCVTGADCSTSSCSAATKLCLAPTCNDGAKNGSEADVDCGGGCPAKCGAGKICTKNGDCASNSCVMGVCN